MNVARRYEVYAQGLVVMSLFGLASTAEAQLSFSDPTNLSQTPNTGKDNFVLKASGDSLYAAWHDYGSFPDFNVSRIRFTKSDDEGATWTPPINIANVITRYSGPSIVRLAAVGSHVYVMWTLTNDSAVADLYFAHSSDRGGTFSSPSKLSSGNLNQNCSNCYPKPVMAANETGIYIIWASYAYNGVLLFTRSTDGGATFSSPTQLPNAVTSIEYMSLDADGQQLHFVGNGYNTVLVYGRSTNGGQTFEPFRQVHSHVWNFTPEVQVFGANVYISFKQSPPVFTGGNDVALIRSTDGGATFGSPSVMSGTYQNACQERPGLFLMNGPHLYMTWFNLDPTNPEGACTRKILAHSIDGGATWLPLIVLPNIHEPTVSGGGSNYEIASKDSRLYLAWPQAFGTAWPVWKVYFADSPDYGTTFPEPPVDISEPVIASPGIDSAYDPPAVLLTNNRVHVFFRAGSGGEGGGGMQDLYLRSALFVDPSGSAPAAVTEPASLISQSGATLNGSDTPNSANANATTGWFEWGTTTAYGNVTAAQALGTGAAGVAISQGITGLTPNTTYHFRAVGQNETDTVYGADLSFSTPALPPVVSICSASNVTLTSATLTGTANPNGASGTAWFEGGATTSYGNSTPPQAISGSANNPVSAGLTGLAPGTTYHCRVVAQNSGGASYGPDGAFTTASPDTGFRSPTANAPETSAAGDNNGYQTTPANAHADDTLNAVDTDSGANNSKASCTDSGKDKHQFYNYGFAIPSGVVINGIEVRLDAMVDGTGGAPKICVQLSGDGGASWTTAQNTPTLSTTMTTYVVGSSTNTWGRVWSANDVSNTNFRVRVIDVSGNSSRDFFLDWVAVRVHLGDPVAPTITSVPVTTGKVGWPYAYQATAAGTPPITWSLVSGPSGMAIDSTAGLVTWTPSVPGDVAVEIRATNVAGSANQSYTITVTNPANTGLLSPTANAADSGGDGNGYQTTPANAYTDDTLNAVDTGSGSGNNTSCANSNKDKHRFYNYGINMIPNGSTITGIEVRVDAMADNTSGSPKICVQLSWDGGVTWTTDKSTPTLGITMGTFTLGSATDTWGLTWNVNDFSDANFLVRVTNVAGNTSRDFFLDWVAVSVHY